MGHRAERKRLWMILISGSVTKAIAAAKTKGTKAYRTA